MVNCVDPDQTDLGLHYVHMPFVSTFSVQNFRGHLPNISFVY